MNRDLQRQLFAICRESVGQAVRTGLLNAYLAPRISGLEVPAAVFVTIRKGGELRGCIGTIEARQLLPQAVAAVAACAAISDHRFPPVAPEEVEELDFEISILTGFREIREIGQIEIGRHGLLVTQGSFRGLLLPQVATENHLDRTEFLERACRKAGLPPGSWKSREISVSIFEGQILCENRSRIH